MAVTGLAQVALGVQDLARAEAFYRDVVGLRHLATFDPPGLVFLDLGGTRLLLERGAPASLLYLGVDNVEDSLGHLVLGGATLEQEPHLIHRDDTGAFGTPHAETWMAFVRDSEGNLLGLTETRLA